MANLIYYRNSATEEWNSIPAIKGDKGDKGDPGTSADLSNYYTREEADEFFASIGYVDDAVEDIVIPDVSQFQTEEQVNALINTALGVIENGTY